MKKLAMAVVLTCVLSGTIFAGNMPTVGVADPPPPPPTTSSTLLTNVILTIIGLR